MVAEHDADTFGTYQLAAVVVDDRVIEYDLEMRAEVQPRVSGDNPVTAAFLDVFEDQAGELSLVAHHYRHRHREQSGEKEQADRGSAQESHPQPDLNPGASQGKPKSVRRARDSLAFGGLGRAGPCSLGPARAMLAAQTGLEYA